MTLSSKSMTCFLCLTTLFACGDRMPDVYLPAVVKEYYMDFGFGSSWTYVGDKANDTITVRLVSNEAVRIDKGIERKATYFNGFKLKYEAFKFLWVGVRNDEFSLMITDANFWTIGVFPINKPQFRDTTINGVLQKNLLFLRSIATDSEVNLLPNGTPFFRELLFEKNVGLKYMKIEHHPVYGKINYSLIHHETK